MQWKLRQQIHLYIYIHALFLGGICFQLASRKFSQRSVLHAGASPDLKLGCPVRLVQTTADGFGCCQSLGRGTFCQNVTISSHIDVPPVLKITWNVLKCKLVIIILPCKFGLVFCWLIRGSLLFWFWSFWPRWIIYHGIRHHYPPWN